MEVRYHRRDSLSDVFNVHLDGVNIGAVTKELMFEADEKELVEYLVKKMEPNYENAIQAKQSKDL